MGVNLISGFSTLVLNENKVNLNSNNVNMTIGEANNLNKVHYSGNIGLGLNYSISKNINFNFEPVFKYQVNTFSNDVGNFKPFAVGIYSGINYRF